MVNKSTKIRHPEPNKTFSDIKSQETALNTLARIIQAIRLVLIFSKCMGLSQQDADKLIRAARVLQNQVCQSDVRIDPLHNDGTILYRLCLFKGDEYSDEVKKCFTFSDVVVDKINKFGEEYPDRTGFYDELTQLYLPDPGEFEEFMNDEGPCPALLVALHVNGVNHIVEAGLKDSKPKVAYRRVYHD